MAWNMKPRPPGVGTNCVSPIDLVVVLGVEAHDRVLHVLSTSGQAERRVAVGVDVDDEVVVEAQRVGLLCGHARASPAPR